MFSQIKICLVQFVYLFRDIDVKRFETQRYYLPKGTIKNYNVIFNGKNFYDHSIGSDIKLYEEIRKLTTGQGEDYTTYQIIIVSKIKID